MTTTKKYWIASLSLIISLGLVIPFCCHAHASVNVSHSHQRASLSQSTNHTHHHLVDCTCGHQLGKENTKTNNSSYQFLQEILLLAVFSDHLLPHKTDQQTETYWFVPAIRDDAGPSLHILNSVFLN